ncbi:regulator of G protein-like protein [Xylariomycetidae sp. FL2044]|nr:regulator of G protein-like protein [Xylariomycetidae sp. FL2044]
MSLLFYRHAKEEGSTRPSLTEDEYASYLKKGESLRGKALEGLGFEDIVKNETLPPCSLNDFMDYLVYVERKAENLQFLLWYCDYVQRWSHLPQSKKDLSPTWNSSKTASVRPSHCRSSSLGRSSSQIDRILSILDQRAPRHDSGASTSNKSHNRSDSASTNFSWPRTPTAGVEKQTSTQWQPLSAQPFREEIRQIAQHYISTHGPRSLNLTEVDRTACMLAIQSTTHPSALLPAFAAAEAVLRGGSHPNFIQWSVCNSNRPRVFFTRALGVVLIFLALSLTAVLCLTRLNPLFRVSAAPLWCVGLFICLTSRRGVCAILHWQYKRDLRPWEQAVDHEDPETAGALEGAGQEEWHPNFQGSGRHKRNDSTLSCSRVDPLRKESLRTFGASNRYNEEAWVAAYQKKPVWRRVFEQSVAIQNTHLRMAQDRVVFHAMLLASLLTVGLTAGSVVIPSAAIL